MRRISFSVLVSLLAGVSAMAGDDGKKVLTPAETPEPLQPWRFSLALPAWIPWQSGDVGLHGKTSHLKLGPDDIIPKLDMIATVRAEAHKGQLGFLTEYSYMSLSDGVGTAGLIKKLDVRTDQHVGELGASWRVLQGEKGWLDVFAGVRYTNLYQALGIHPDEGAIDAASGQLVDSVAGGVREKLESKIRSEIEDRLEALQGRDPVLPAGPIGDALRREIAERVRTIVQRRKAELDGAIRSGIQSRVDAVKSSLQKEIARAVTDKLSTRVARTDDWWDPFVGLKGRYYLSKAFYLTGRADIGGFGVGSDLAWQVNAGLGCQVTSNIFAETTYRVYSVDYRHDGLTYDVLTQGVEVSLGVNF